MTLLELMRAATTTTTPHQKIRFAGFNVEIEYPRGSIRELRNEHGQVAYKKLMLYPYGFICDTKGRDTDEVDVVLGPDEDAREVYIAHMIDKGPDVDKREDEDKVLLGFTNYAAALKAFHSIYPQEFFGGMTVLPRATFRQKLKQAQLPHREKKIHAREGDR